MEEKTVEIPFVRGQLLTSMTALDYYQRTVEMVKVIDEQIKVLSEENNLPTTCPFRNPREESIFLHNSKTLSVMQRQRERLREKLSQLEEIIRGDMEIKKQLTPLKQFEVSPDDLLGGITPIRNKL